ncbi:MAG: hypothetical protein KDA61_19155, partial [Planctomycetales bacterium]|nr:hypothetical protein [Planctomycetales bacterium]
DGFLPPNDDTGRGDGFVAYTIRPLAELSTGDVISQQASIVFDVNEPILTNIYTNVIDVASPTSSVDPLPAAVVSPSIDVSWSGADDAGISPGSGIAFFDVFVSENGGPFSRWQTRTSETSATFEGQTGNTYSFYSIAIDGVGLAELPPATFDTQTTVQAGILNADFDGDSDVDDDDLALWEAGFGTASGATISNGDGDADGDVDGFDLLAWQRQFRPAAAMVAAIAAFAVPDDQIVDDEPADVVSAIGIALQFDRYDAPRAPGERGTYALASRSELVDCAFVMSPAESLRTTLSETQVDLAFSAVERGDDDAYSPGDDLNIDWSEHRLDDVIDAVLTV